MTNRLPEPNYKIPDRYTVADFKDVLDDLQKKYVMKVEDGAIKINLFSKCFTVDKFGKKFDIYIFAFCGQVDITVKEHKE